RRSRRARPSIANCWSGPSRPGQPRTSTPRSPRHVPPRLPGPRPRGAGAPAAPAARPAQPAGAATPWRERLAIVRRAAEYISDRLMAYSADMAIEVGKNRIEALGEVEESADLLRYYSQTMADNDGYDLPMGNLG